MSETMQPLPFVLSLSKDGIEQHPHFDRLEANGSIQGNPSP